MVKGILKILKDFFSRDGGSVFLAMVISRFISFFSSWIALQLIDEKKLGLVLYAYSFLVFLIPIGGWGLNQGYIRYAAISKNEDYKNQLFNFVFKKGFFISAGFSILLLLITNLFVKDVSLKNYFSILSFSILSFFFYELFKSYFRVHHRNKIFAYLEIVYSAVLLVLVFGLSYYFKGTGYSIALAFSPLIAVLFFIPLVTFQKSENKKPDNVNIAFYKYGFYAEMAGVASYLLYSIDLILVGSIMKQPEAVTHFKYVSIIPYSFLFLPSVLITADFVRLTENIERKDIIQDYIKNYWKLFSLISVVVMAVSFLFPKLILSIFNKNLEQHTLTFQILMFGVVGVLMFRGLFGNLLSSIGKTHINFWISTFGLMINIVTNYWLIPIYGINGAAITSSIIMWLSGISSFLLFRKYQNRLLNEGRV